MVSFTNKAIICRSRGGLWANEKEEKFATNDSNNNDLETSWIAHWSRVESEQGEY